MHIVGTVDGHGYDGQLKYTLMICDGCRPCHSILSICTEASFATYWLCLQLTQMPRSPDLAIILWVKKWKKIP